MCFCRYFVGLSQVRYEHPYQKKKDHPTGWSFLFLWLAEQARICYRVMSPTSVARWGSDPTAAGGGRREGSEWPGSARDAGAPSPRTFAGAPNRGDTQNRNKKPSVTKSNRVLPPQPTMRTDLDIEAEKSETITVSDFFYANFHS